MGHRNFGLGERAGRSLPGLTDFGWAGIVVWEDKRPEQRRRRAKVGRIRLTAESGVGRNHSAAKHSALVRLVPWKSSLMSNGRK